jgi:hypothetical protein
MASAPLHDVETVAGHDGMPTAAVSGRVFPRRDVLP